MSIRHCARTMKHAVLIAAMLAAATSASLAAAEKRQFEVAAGSAVQTLNEFSRQANIQLLFDSDAVRSFQTQAVSGDLEVADALAQLLGGTSLVFEFVNERTVAVMLRGARPKSLRTSSAGRTNEYTRLAQAKDGSPQSSSSSAATSESLERQRIALEEVVVTGTQIRGQRPVGSNVITLDRDAIDHTGYTTTAGVIQTLPQNFSGSYQESNGLNSRFGHDIAFGGSVDLRGLGPDATLTLLNGRRLAPAGSGDFVDISAIPLAAVERIEILADGASATYGSDAVAGVANFILRRDYEGAETTVRYGNGTSGEPEELYLGQLLGTHWASGSLLTAFEFYRREQLRAAERDFAATSDLTRFGGLNYGSNLSSPGNITRIGATPVTLAIPSGQDGTSLTESELLPGVTHYENQQSQLDLLPQQERYSVFVSARQALSDALEIFGEAIYTQREAVAHDQQGGTTLVVPETNAYRLLNGLFPGQGPIRIAYSFADDLGPYTYTPDSEALNIVAGASLGLGAAWRSDFHAQLGRLEETHRFGEYTDTAAVNAALASSDLATAFNPFSDGSNTNPAVLAGLGASQRGGNDSRLWSLNLKADGPLLRLPAGEMRLALGADYRHEEFERWHFDISASGVTVAATLPPPGARDAAAIFAEALVPLAAPENEVSGFHRLELSGSVRYDDYEGIGAKATSKIGLRWSPLEGLAARGTWGTSFKVPQFRQTLGSTGGSLAVAPASLDPKATNGSTGVLQMSGGNPDLTPEEATTWTAGIDINPPSLHGLRLSATYFDVDFRDRIDTPPNILIAFQQEESFPGLFIRNPTPAQIEAALAQLDRVNGSIGSEGIEVIYDLRLQNLSSVLVRGVDVSGDYRVPSRIGDFIWSLNVSYLFEFSKDLGLGGAPIELLDTVYHPVDLRVRSGVAWQSDAWRVSGSINYVDDYLENESTPGRRVDSWTTFDLQVAYTFKGAARGAAATDHILSGTRLALSVLNVADEDPPFVNNFLGGGYDQSNASLLGRFVSLTLSRDW